MHETRNAAAPSQNYAQVRIEALSIFLRWEVRLEYGDDNVTILFMRGMGKVIVMCPSWKSSSSQSQRNDCDLTLVHRGVAFHLD